MAIFTDAKMASGSLFSTSLRAWSFGQEICSRFRETSGIGSELGSTIVLATIMRPGQMSFSKMDWLLKIWSDQNMTTPKRTKAEQKIYDKINSQIDHFSILRNEFFWGLMATVLVLAIWFLW